MIQIIGEVLIYIFAFNLTDMILEKYFTNKFIKLCFIIFIGITGFYINYMNNKSKYKGLV